MRCARQGPKQVGRFHDVLRSREAANHAARVSLLCQRRAGQLLADAVSHEGGRPSKHSQRERASDLGIDHNQSSRWQRVARVADDVFDRLRREAAYRPSDACAIVNARPGAAGLAPEVHEHQPLSDPERRYGVRHPASSSTAAKRCCRASAPSP